MSPENFATRLDRLAEINGMTRAQIDTLAFDTRAKIFRQHRVTASDDQVLDGMQQVLASVAARMESEGR